MLSKFAPKPVCFLSDELVAFLINFFARNHGQESIFLAYFSALRYIARARVVPRNFLLYQSTCDCRACVVEWAVGELCI